MKPAILPPAGPAAAEADEIFAALDQRLVGRDDDRWQALITAIVPDDSDWWIQVSSSDQTKVLMRASRWATTAQIVTALQRCEPSEAAHPPIIDVMRIRKAA